MTETETNYYIRAIENVFVIGQTFPAVEVPGPHSRKITNLTKLRLHNIAQRLTERSTDSRLKIQSLMKYFNDQNELQMRQRLKVSFACDFFQIVCQKQIVFDLTSIYARAV